MSTIKANRIENLTTTNGGISINNSGNVGVGTSSPSSLLHLAANAPYITFEDVDNNQDWQLQATAWFALRNQTTSSELLRVDSSGNVGIGTSSPNVKLHVSGGNLNVENTVGNAIELKTSVNNGNDSTFKFQKSRGGSGTIADVQDGDDIGTLSWGGYYNGAYQNDSTIRAEALISGGSYSDRLIYDSKEHNFRTNNASRIFIDDSGNVGIGTTTPGAKLEISSSANTAFRITDSSGSYSEFIYNDDGSSTSALVIDSDPDNTSVGASQIRIRVDGSEKMRFHSGGQITVGTSSINPGISNTNTGCSINGDGYISASRNNPVAYFSRPTTDGQLVSFAHAGTAEGNISVSGTTVSYVGGHLARWSQLAGGADRTEILRGSVLSNLDEMCEWGEEDNEQLNRMKVSDVEGDVNVAGVFQSWDDDDDTYTNDFYCAMTGDFVIRIAQGTTVARGDLLMSAGDGTAKPQDDDIVRSKTIAKVTSTVVSETYTDGSYCVPCVLIAC